jgi:hypothetical protein
MTLEAVSTGALQARAGRGRSLLDAEAVGHRDAHGEQAHEVGRRLGRERAADAADPTCGLLDHARLLDHDPAEVGPAGAREPVADVAAHLRDHLLAAAAVDEVERQGLDLVLDLEPAHGER